MKVGRQYRGDAEKELDALVAGIQGGWNRQHDAEGGHGAMTATSLETTGDLDVGGVASLSQPRALLRQETQEVSNLEIVTYDVTDALTGLYHSAGSITILTPGLYHVSAQAWFTENDGHLMLLRTRSGAAVSVAAGTYVAGVTVDGASVLSTVVPLKAHDVLAVFVVVQAGPDPGTLGFSGLAPAYSNQVQIVRLDA